MGVGLARPFFDTHGRNHGPPIRAGFLFLAVNALYIASLLASVAGPEAIRRPAEALASRDPAEHLETDGIRDILLLAVLLDGYAGRSTEAAWRLYSASLLSQ